MLAEAGRLTLELAQDLLPHGFGLKDATPYNVLYRGTAPVFVDVLSIERRDARDPTWRAYAQFTRTFLAPLVANHAFGLRLDSLLLTRRDGLEPEDLYRLAGPLRRLLPPFVTLATLPTWLARVRGEEAASAYAPRSVRSPEQALFVLSSIFNGLRRPLERLQRSKTAFSAWSSYEAENRYTKRDVAAKTSFVEAALVERRPASVLDLGCNTGRFSLLAAGTGARVVAADSDPAVVGEVWRRARAERRDVLPLVVDISRPSPALGWRYGEHASFLARARGSFDLVLMLALVHHLTVGEGVPLAEVAALAAELTCDTVVVERVDPSDPQFRRLARGRDALFADQDQPAFEAAFERYFETVRFQALPDAPRSLYLLRIRGPSRA
jgi:SAM-dependent methyltransferase